ncbi:ligase-associated DNA damage response endonuclease PdeM [Algoriphagus sp. H41]|uniref:Ligase-associated DNA damage response endonuclease PdeM n=1 Tax=Algoriphagus oliviformis TaxID=2811231 RepID=A0ABS3C4N3_9BACT|nr:ligase-associated DNA damage response endonuclease PdeM [Algoriphagus oliviformis]MBN7812074.1 ligase-associated DNA damage response endonuclease PdeM [Algoriphagus oliviformis]
MDEAENLTQQRSGHFTGFQSHTLGFLLEKALWVKDLDLLLIADLHFGKAAHFRKSGIPIPEPVHNLDLIRLQQLHSEFRPKDTYFLGDLFHSDWNGQWTYLNQFLESFGHTTFHLVKGNHDVLSPEAYRQSVLQIHKEPLEIGPFLLSHEPMDTIPPGKLNICGHIHPGVRLTGKARQSVMLPCFFQSESQLLLPAFGNFTGLARIRPKAGDKIWAIAPGKIIPLVSGTSIG